MASNRVVLLTPEGRATCAALDLEARFPSLGLRFSEVAAALIPHFTKACALPAVPADFPSLPAPSKEIPNGKTNRT